MGAPNQERPVQNGGPLPSILLRAEGDTREFFDVRTRKVRVVHRAAWGIARVQDHEPRDQDWWLLAQIESTIANHVFGRDEDGFVDVPLDVPTRVDDADF